MSTPTNKYKKLEDLLLKGMSGDQAAYTTFLHHITPLLRRMVERRIVTHEVEDIVQEILISVHKARHTYDGKRPLIPWLSSIARFRIMDHLRKHYTQIRNYTIDIDEFEEILADTTEEEKDSVDKLLQDIPEKQRKILTLMHVEGYTAKEVGIQLGMNESAVKVVAHRTIKKIREKFNI